MLLKHETKKYESIELLSKFRTFIPFLQFKSVVEGETRLGNCIGKSFYSHEDVVFELLDHLLILNQTCYCEETRYIGYCLICNREYEKSLVYFRLAREYEKDPSLCQYYILLATLGVSNTEEFVECDKFTYENEEYIQLLLLLQDNPEKMATYIALADKNVKRQEAIQTEQIHRAEATRHKVEEEIQRAASARREAEAEMPQESEKVSENGMKRKIGKALFALLITAGLLMLFAILIYLWK